jgi:hypothetical protein
MFLSDVDLSPSCLGLSYVFLFGLHRLCFCFTSPSTFALSVTLSPRLSHTNTKRSPPTHPNPSKSQQHRARAANSQLVSPSAKQSSKHRIQVLALHPMMLMRRR